MIIVKKIIINYEREWVSLVIKKIFILNNPVHFGFYRRITVILDGKKIQLGFFNFSYNKSKALRGYNGYFEGLKKDKYVTS